MIYIRDNHTIFMFNQKEYNKEHYAKNKSDIRKRQNARNQANPEEWNKYIRMIYSEEPRRTIQIITNRFNYRVRTGKMAKDEAKEKRLIAIADVENLYKNKDLEGMRDVLANLERYF